MPILATRVLHWPDEAACAATARRMAQAHPARLATIALHGPLGAGKTTFVRHLLRALGVTGAVKSPTYAVVEPYDLPDGGSAWHFDFYRFADPREWEDAGLRDIYASDGLKIAEWPELAGTALPTPDLAITLAPLDDDRGPGGDPGDPGGGASTGSRRVRLDAHTVRGLALLPPA